jgi:hypothetical protein
MKPFLRLRFFWCAVFLVFLPACSHSPTSVTPNSTPLLVNSIFPTEAMTGDTMRIMGKGFGADSNDLQARIGNTLAKIIRVSDSVLVVLIPAGQVSGNVVVTRGSQRATSTKSFKLLQTTGVVTFRDTGYSSIVIGISNIFGDWKREENNDGSTYGNTTSGISGLYNVYAAGSGSHIGTSFQTGLLSLTHQIRTVLYGDVIRLASFSLTATYDSTTGIFKDLSLNLQDQSQYQQQIKPVWNTSFGLHAKNLRALMAGDTVIAVLWGPEAVRNLLSAASYDFRVDDGSGYHSHTQEFSNFGTATDSTEIRILFVP